MTYKHFKISDEIACDSGFRSQLTEEMGKWYELRKQGLDILTWWEIVVKPGIRSIAQKRSREVKEERQGQLNLYLIKQAYYVRKLRSDPSNISHLKELKTAQILICDWFRIQSEKIKIQSRKYEFQKSEATRIYHHKLHKKSIKRVLFLNWKLKMV